MPYLETSQSWLAQSTLLLQARPSTTRITTKYTLLKPSPTSKPQTSTTTTTNTPDPPRANLILKTYDPVSGTTLKYRTTKAAEVSRLIAILGRLGRPMAGLAPLPLDAEPPTDMPVNTTGNGSGPGTPAVDASNVPVLGVGAGKSAGGVPGGAVAGKKGKKKGGKK